MGRPRVVIVGAGFAGYHTARSLARRARGRADIVLINPTDYFLYLPLLPEVATGILEPRHCTVSIPNTLPGVRLLLAEAHSLDIQRRRLSYVDPEGGHGQLEYDRLVLAAGSVNRLLPIPGIAEHAHGFRGLPEALYLRDHLTRQVELAAGAPDPDERLSATADRVLRGRGVEVRTGTSVQEAMADGVRLSDGQFDSTRTLIWCV